MSEVPVRVTVRNGTITIRFPTKLISRQRATRRRRSARGDLHAFKAVEGIWKGREPNGLAYQRKVRREWD
jgi:hypothetical protein